MYSVQTVSVSDAGGEAKLEGAVWGQVMSSSLCGVVWLSVCPSPPVGQHIDKLQALKPVTLLSYYFVLCGAGTMVDFSE